MVAALGRIEGLRIAEPGEFSWRAFANGKMDLSEVEGLADLVDAETEAQREQALRMAGGNLRRECEAVRSLLLDALATVEMCLDFSDVEGVDDSAIQSSLRAVEAARLRIAGAVSDLPRASCLREGFSVAIVGPPNVGKSTLINTLAGRDVAITSPVAGTTRDVIEVFMELRGYPVVFVDTAGIRPTADPVEREGVERAKRRAETADLVLWLQDEECSLASSTGRAVYRVHTKVDLCANGKGGVNVDGQFSVSAKTGAGIKELLTSIGDLAEESHVQF